jgi:hypothetical protein
MVRWARRPRSTEQSVICCREPTCSTAAPWMPTSWSPRSANIRSMWSGLPLGPRVGNIRVDKAMTCRPLSSIGRQNRHAVPKGSPVSNGRRVVMCPVIPSCASVLTGPPVAPVRPVRCAPRRKTPHGNSPSGRRPTTKPSRPRDSARRRRSAKPNRRYGLAWRAASRKGSGAAISARVATWG